MRPLAITTTSLVAVFAAACAGGPGANSTGANTSPADTPTRPTCDDWGSRNIFRSASPEEVRECLQAGADPNGPPGLHPLPPLFIAAGVTPHPTVISLLVAAGADVDARKWGGLTPLHEATGRDTHAAVVTALVEAGVNPNAQDRDGIAPLHLAARNGNLDIVTALVEAGADPDVRGPSGNTPMHMAWSGLSPGPADSHIAVIRELMWLGADRFAQNDLGQIADPTHCVHWQAAVFHRVAAPADFARCLEEGADVHVRYEHDNTVLHHAASLDAAVTTLLLEAGAQVNARNNTGRTPLHWAAANRNSATVAALLEAGADPGPVGTGWIDDPPCDFSQLGLLGRVPPETVRDCLQTGIQADRPIWFDRAPLLYLAEMEMDRDRATPEKIALFLKAGADPNTRNRNGDTPLHIVARGGARADVVADALLAAEADVNARNHEGWTPLHNAARARGGDTTLLRLLLQAGADVDARTQLGETPLHLATAGQRHRNAWQDRAEFITALLEAGAEVNARTNDGQTPLHVALQADRPAAAMRLLEAGADPAALDGAGNLADPAACERWGAATFFAAAGADVVAGCLDAGADPNPAPGTEDRNWPTLLHVASVHARDPAVITALVRAGTDVHARDRFGYTPLHHAAENGTPAAVRALLRAGADIHARQRRLGSWFSSRGGPTPLHSAASNPDPEVAAVLLDADADVGAPEGPWGWTALHMAARNRNPEVARLLLEAGANVNARMFSGLTPLHDAATANPNPAALAVLLQAGADPNALGESSDCAHWKWSGNLTPLYGAARVNRNPEIVEVLVAAGADVDGKTPMDYARENAALRPWKRVKMSTPLDKK